MSCLALLRVGLLCFVFRFVFVIRRKASVFSVFLRRVVVDVLGFAASLCNLAISYDNGSGVEKDDFKSMVRPQVYQHAAR